MNSVHDFREKKKNGEKIAVLTCYDAAMAAILTQADVDCILVGDSAAMVIHGYGSTVAATQEMMVLHTAAVRRGAPGVFIVADMPFLAHRMGKYEAVRHAGELVQAGANAVKLEEAAGHTDAIEHIVESGIPVMGHLGLTPQSVNRFGGFKVQGKSKESASSIREDALRLERAGCFAIVLECIPAELGSEISKSLTIPTIGIGAGAGTDGQVLVLYDLLGLTTNIRPRFVRKFSDMAASLQDAVNSYCIEVKNSTFPAEKESY
ncbi:MAG: 3-methyl-2-oxobutanoate hydroxymethyltransferase [Spirochaetales bacterium]|nr:3-methyl-2-oxobutanoate hydroxymethyltransferase [Spirochaetales bacterium]